MGDPRMSQLAAIDDDLLPETSFRLIGDSAPRTPAIYRFQARIRGLRERIAPPRVIPAPNAVLRSHPCGAVCSAQADPNYQNV
jgi:hypothetical protein